MTKLGCLIMLLFCYISFPQWPDQNNAAQEFLQGRRTTFLPEVRAAENSPSPLRTTSNKIKFGHRKLSDDAYCNSFGRCSVEAPNCPDGCYCGVFRCAKPVGSNDLISSDMTNLRRLKFAADEEYCNVFECSSDPAVKDVCPDYCFCGAYICAAY